jgi:hypothetical protein
MREVKAEGYTVRLDLSQQVLAIDIPPDYDFFGRTDDPEFEARAVISPTLPESTWRSRLTSASMLAQKAKQFDDGLYAAVDLAAQSGAGHFEGKARLLQSLARSLSSPGVQPAEGAVVVFAACEVAGLQVDVPAPIRAAVERWKQAFLSDELRSKPIGFYTWSPQLGAIFQQDRALGTKLDGGAGIESLVRALHGDATARATYEGYLDLVSKLTNPLAGADLRPLLAGLDSGAQEPPGAAMFFFPSSRAYETDLGRMLYGRKPIPDGFSLVDEMIARIRSGQLDLQPRPDSGWYDHQTWALEPLVVPEKMPEAAHLQFGDDYRKQLLELFKGILALTRETHVKQLEVGVYGAAMVPMRPLPEIFISPELSAEPLATHYLRRALSYRFVQAVLVQAFGSTALEGMHRLTREGPVAPSLAAELVDMEALFNGAYVTVSRQLGMAPDTSVAVGSPNGAGADAARFARWTQKLATDPDLARDARMMVPVFYDIARQRTKVWVFLGWTSQPVNVSFSKPPAAEIFDGKGAKVDSNTVHLQFVPCQYELAYPVTAEVYVGKLLDRDAFRRLCDTYKTREAILAHLE